MKKINTCCLLLASFSFMYGADKYRLSWAELSEQQFAASSSNQYDHQENNSWKQQKKTKQQLTPKDVYKILSSKMNKQNTSMEDKLSGIMTLIQIFERKIFNLEKELKTLQLNQKKSQEYSMQQIAALQKNQSIMAQQLATLSAHLMSRAQEAPQHPQPIIAEDGTHYYPLPQTQPSHIAPNFIHETYSPDPALPLRLGWQK